MVDAPNNNFDPQQPVAPIAEEKPANFFTSTLGKAILGGVVLIVALGLIGAAVWFFMFNTPSADTKITPRVVAPAASTPTSASAPVADATPITEPQQKPLESTFTFRNVFAPTLKKPTPASVISSITSPAAAASTGSDSGSGSGSSSTGRNDKDTLYLVSIQTVDGQKTATFIWNGATYTLSDGDTLTGTPWKVVEIGNSSVVMLFGDTQVTLTAGQGLSK